MTSGTVLVAVALLVLAACGSDRPQRANSAEGATLVFDGTTATITVDRVTDGDSLRASGPDGPLEIRLLGLNTPESGECLGSEAKAQLEGLLADAGLIELGPWPGETDQFGRMLGFVIMDGLVVNAELIERGFAVARAQSDHGFAVEFEEAEQRAADAGRGLWAPDACGAPTSAAMSIVEVLANAPGDDRENPNGEWVLFRNDGDEPVDLANWSLRDESTRHRYEFPAIEVDAGAEFRVRTGCGVDDLGSEPIELFWCDPEPPVWNNDSDTVFLLDPNGGIADHLRSR